MHVEQIYTGCLAQGAYYIRSGGEAAIVDPLREVEPYLERLAADGVELKYIFETHFHADFVSGHVTLAQRTGAPIVYGPGAETGFEAHVARDGEVFRVGDVTIVALHTPGHTLESTCYLLRDERGEDHALFSGDTLFLGDVGRPDLAQLGSDDPAGGSGGADLTQDDLAGMLYDSLREKVMPLADDVLVYPAHGAGSACGKNMSSETVGTIGGQRAANYALRQDMTREEFVREVTDGLTEPPAYFPLNVALNKGGDYADAAEVVAKGARPLSPEAFERVANDTGAVVLDVRGKADYAAGHVPRSTFIGLDGSFAPWVGAMIRDTEQPILLVAPDDRVEEAVTRLARVGFDRVLGHLDGGVAAWRAAGKELDSVRQVDAETFVRERGARPKAPVVDVRKPAEYADAHLEGALNAPLSELNAHLGELKAAQPFALHCASGYRSLIAASVLKSRGIHGFVEVAGGWKAIAAAEAEGAGVDG